MTPEVSEAVGQVVAALRLTSGPTLDELQDAASHATAVDDLPRWALNALVGIRARGAAQAALTGREPVAVTTPADSGPTFDEKKFDDPDFVGQVFGGDQGAADFASRMLGDPDGLAAN